MPASEELAKRVLEAGRYCSLTKAVLEEWARAGSPKQVEYLAAYLEAERASREASKRASLLRRCALPAPKTFDGYDWSAVSWPDGLGREDLLSLSFLERREDLVLMGDVGDGQDAHGERPVPACLRQTDGGSLLHRLLARHAPQARTRRGQARPRDGAGRPRPPARDRRARVPATRRRRGAPCLPGLRRRLRAPERGHHDPTWSSPAGEGCSGTTRWLRPSSTASCTTAGSSSSEVSPTA